MFSVEGSIFFAVSNSDSCVCLSYVGVQSRARAGLINSSVITADVSQQIGSVMETMTVVICQMNRTAVSYLHILWH